MLKNLAPIPEKSNLYDHRGEVLVAILNNRHDFNTAYEQHWYRIPTSSVEKLLKNRWPPQLLAFYQTKSFGAEAHAVNYFAQVLHIREVGRQQLFPDEPYNPKSTKCYYQLFLAPLQRLSRPIFSRRLRRIVFIPTTVEKFRNAVEINDLYDESPLEDRLWAEFKRVQIQAERQELVKVNNHNYMLDFAIYCAKGNIDVETDGDLYCYRPNYLIKNKQNLVRLNGSPPKVGEAPTGPGQIK